MWVLNLTGHLSDSGRVLMLPFQEFPLRRQKENLSQFSSSVCGHLLPFGENLWCRISAFIFLECSYCVHMSRSEVTSFHKGNIHARLSPIRMSSTPLIRIPAVSFQRTSHCEGLSLEFIMTTIGVHSPGCNMHVSAGVWYMWTIIFRYEQILKDAWP